MMNILCWNVQGLDNEVRTQYLRKIAMKNKVGILGGFIETNIKEKYFLSSLESNWNMQDCHQTIRNQGKRESFCSCGRILEGGR